KRMQSVTDWKQVSVLSVQVGHAVRWHRPGLVLIGDAAHIMSPIGGVGINHAMMDAVAAANLLTEPLRSGTLREAHLARLQRRREWPARLVQRFQTFVQNRIVAAALKRDTPLQVPAGVKAFTKLRWLERVIAETVCYGIRPERLLHREPWLGA